MQSLDLGARRDHAHDRRGGSGRQREDAALFLGRRILDDDVEHEPIELRLGQRVRAFLLDRVLGREDEQRPLQVEAHAVDRDLVFLHRLEQRRLRLRRRAVDLVGEDDVREDRTADEPDDALAGRAVFFDDLGAEDVGRHQIGRELNAVELEVHRVGELLDEQRLGQPGDAAQQAVPAGEERDEDLADHPLLADDGLGQLALEAAGDLGHALERRRLRAAPLGHVPVAIGHRRECTTAGSDPPSLVAPDIKATSYGEAPP